MNKTNDTKFLEWLTVIANTRLVYSTLGELENYLDNHNISTNGISRCYPAGQKARAAFYDLYMNVDSMTDGNVKLDDFMKDYEKASAFVKKGLSRRKDPAKIALGILNHFYSAKKENCSKSMLELIDSMRQDHIDITMVILLLMGALHGYNSKDGDIDDFMGKYDAVINLLDEFTKECNATKKLDQSLK